jgi:hypothetical protein
LTTDSDLIPYLNQVLLKDFSIPPATSLQTDWLALVQEKVEEYLGSPSGVEFLMHILYRLDISESKVNQAFNAPNSSSIAKELSCLILEREIQKAESRRKYRSSGNTEF